MLSVGTRLGPYEIVGPLGAGGMGEVYRARDTNLKREVALKVLPEGLARDHDRLARFQREAELLATLNHPNIAAVYGLEKTDGVIAIVMELVEGETLDARLTRAFPLDESLAIARQIADALEAAHERGVIHRDLKPANIKITPDGKVKVLDFGLAKLTGPAEAGHHDDPRGVRLQADLTNSPTLASPAMMTGAGMILGTAAYMSPEQAKGRPVDKRADIWAFGVVFYEMLTGTRLFAGESVAETLGLIFSREPDLALLPAATPARVRTLVARCLVKDPRQRLRDIGDAGHRALPSRRSHVSSERGWQLLREAASLTRTWLRAARDWLVRSRGPRYFAAMSTLTEIEAAADSLPAEQQQELLLFLATRLHGAGGQLPPPRDIPRAQMDRWIAEDEAGHQHFLAGA